MKIPVPGLTDLNDTNAFLRALWAEIRTRYGKCAWSYQPFKEGSQQLIYLGMIDIDLERTVSVSLKYRTRSILAELHFAELFDTPLDPNSKLGRGLTDAVYEALARRTEPLNMTLQVSVASLQMTLAPYRSEWFKIEPMSKRNMAVSLRVFAFDQLDAESEFLRRLPVVLDILAVETNHLYWVDGAKDRTLATAVGQEGAALAPSDTLDHRRVPDWNAFAAAEDWVDEYPTSGAYALISREAHALIDRVVSASQITEKEGAFARACHHYHVARGQDALIYDHVFSVGTQDLGNGSHELRVAVDSRLVLAKVFSRRAEEVATVLYMSSVEVASAIDAPAPETCNECGQERYRISARVVDYVTTRTPEAGREYMAGVFKRHYGKRSKCLHAGAVLVDHAYAGTTIPLFDLSSDSGVTQHTSVLLVNMREWIGNLLRQQLKEIVRAPLINFA